MTTPNTGIPYVPENTLNPAGGLNAALNVIDALLQTAVIDMDRTEPPGSPSDGDLHIVAGPATAEWENQENNLARYVSEGSFWQFFVAGVQVHFVINKSDLGLYRFDDGSDASWSLAAGLGDAPVDGINYVRRDGEWEQIPDPSTIDAEDVDYDNTSSGLTADNVQDAIDEIAGSSGAAFSGVRVRKSGTQAVSGTTSAIQWDVEDYDTDDYHDNSTNPSRLTAPVNGYYSVIGSLEFSAAGFKEIAIRVDGTTIYATNSFALSLGANSRYQIVAHIALTAGQYVELMAVNTGSGNVVNTNNATAFSMALMGT